MWSRLGRLARRVRRRLRRLRPNPGGAEMPGFAAGYDEVYESLTREELSRDTEELSLEDLTGLFAGQNRTRRFLGFYTEEGATLAFERYGFLQLLRDRGFDPVLSADLSDSEQPVLRFHDGVASPDTLLIELAVGLKDATLPDGQPIRTLFVNWLLMQDPRAEFPPDRPPLPDQTRPGLGLFGHFGYLLRLMAIRLDCDALMNHPAHFHNGALYGRFSYFVDPGVEGRFRALERALRHLSLAESTALVDAGRLVDALSGEPAVWEPVAQILPISPTAQAWIDSPEYRNAVVRERDARAYAVRYVEPADPAAE